MLKGYAPYNEAYDHALQASKLLGEVGMFETDQTGFNNRPLYDVMKYREGLAQGRKCVQRFQDGEAFEYED